MGSNTKIKVGEIFTQAGAAFSRLGELTMQLQSAADDGTPKWTDEEIDMLNIAITRFCSDLTEISLRVKQRGVSQLKQTLKKRIYEDAGIPVKQMSYAAAQPNNGPPPIVLGTADLLMGTPLAAHQQMQQHIVQMQQQQLIIQQQNQQQQQQQQQQQLQTPQQQHFLPQQHHQQQMQHIQLISPTITVQPQNAPQPLQHNQQQQQPQIFLTHMPTAAVIPSSSTIQQLPPQTSSTFAPHPPSNMTSISNQSAGLITTNDLQQHLQHHPHMQPTSNMMMMTLNRLNTTASEPTIMMSAANGGDIVNLTDDGNDGDDDDDDEDDDDDGDDNDGGHIGDNSVHHDGGVLGGITMSIMQPSSSSSSSLAMTEPAGDMLLMADELKSAFDADIVVGGDGSTIVMGNGAEANVMMAGDEPMMEGGGHLGALGERGE